MMTKDDLVFMYCEAGCFIDYTEAAKHLNIKEADFTSSYWDKVNYSRLLEDRINYSFVKVIDCKMMNGYAQGESFLWYKSFDWKYKGGLFRTTNPAKSCFDDNYARFKTMKLVGKPDENI